MRKQLPNFPDKPPPCEVDMILSINPCQRGLYNAKLYNAIFSFQSISVDSLRIIWSQDIGREMDEETWAEVLNRVHSSSICARHGGIQCKVVHRAHWSKSRLVRINT